ncbi:MAG: hypothetical protein GY847_34445 [Proteobacteria bacterium]|nr:hypothetical protein [Pseudomonadota bacterium]
MMKRIFVLLMVALFFLVAAGCGGAQEKSAELEVRPLEENKAFEIIEEMLAERGYFMEKDVPLGLTDRANFNCDYRVKDHKIAIEYLTEQDRQTIGSIPPPAAGSRLHVLNARIQLKDQSNRSEPVYVFFIDDTKFVYHFNPTSDHRADITFLEVDSRLRRDLADFLSWYETSIVNR